MGRFRRRFSLCSWLDGVARLEGDSLGMGDDRPSVDGLRFRSVRHELPSLCRRYRDQSDSSRPAFGLWHSLSRLWHFGVLRSRLSRRLAGKLRTDTATKYAFLLILKKLSWVFVAISVLSALLVLWIPQMTKRRVETHHEHFCRHFGEALVRDVRVRKPFLLVNAIFMGANFSGFIVVISYGVIIFRDSGVPLDAYYTNILVGVVNLVGCFLGMAANAKFGRRTILVFSAFLCGVLMAALVAVNMLK